MTTRDVAAAIIAGGQAARLGGADKSRLVVDGRPIVARQLEVLRQVAGDVFVVAPRHRRFDDLGVKTYEDLIAGAGAIGGLYSALELAPSERVIVVACDLPFLHRELLERLAELAARGDGAWVRSAHGVEPLLACYRRSARQRIRDEITAGRLKLADLSTVLTMAELDGAELARFGTADRLLANVNTPEDLARLQ